MPRIFAFDLFGTVFDLSGLQKFQLQNYAAHIRKPEWSRLLFTDSWYRLPAHPDSAEGIRRLQGAGYLCVTCSNGPADVLAAISARANIDWDAIIPLETVKIFKPRPAAYTNLCRVLNVMPHDIGFVTANESFGDLEASSALGMVPILVRGPKVPDLSALARMVSEGADVRWAAGRQAAPGVPGAEG